MSIDVVAEVARIVAKVAAEKGLMTEDDFMRAFDEGRTDMSEDDPRVTDQPVEEDRP